MDGQAYGDDSFITEQITSPTLAGMLWVKRQFPNIMLQINLHQGQYREEAVKLYGEDGVKRLEQFGKEALDRITDAVRREEVAFQIEMLNILGQNKDTDTVSP